MKPVRFTVPKKGAAIFDVLITAGVLSIFIGAILFFISSESSVKNRTDWMKSIMTDLDATIKHITLKGKLAAYPEYRDSTGKIRKKFHSMLGMHFLNGDLKSVDAASRKDKNYGTVFLAFTDWISGKPSSGPGEKIVFYYHTYALTKEGELVYSQYKEEMTNEQLQNFKPTSIPSKTAKANGGIRKIILRDVIMVRCDALKNHRNSPISVYINCKYPYGDTTTRSHRGVITHLVNVKKHTDTKSMNQ